MKVGLFGGMLNGHQRILRGHADRSMVGPTIGCHVGAAEWLHALHKFLSSNQQRAERVRPVMSHRNDSNRHLICPQKACGQLADSADIRNLADKSEFRAHRLAALAVHCFGPVSLRLYIHLWFRRRDRANRSIGPSFAQQPFSSSKYPLNSPLGSPSAEGDDLRGLSDRRQVPQPRAFASPKQTPFFPGSENHRLTLKTARHRIPR